MYNLMSIKDCKRLATYTYLVPKSDVLISHFVTDNTAEFHASSTVSDNTVIIMA